MAPQWKKLSQDEIRLAKKRRRPKSTGAWPKSELHLHAHGSKSSSQEASTKASHDEGSRRENEG